MLIARQQGGPAGTQGLTVDSAGIPNLGIWIVMLMSLTPQKLRDITLTELRVADVLMLDILSNLPPPPPDPLTGKILEAR